MKMMNSLTLPLPQETATRVAAHKTICLVVSILCFRVSQQVVNKLWAEKNVALSSLPNKVESNFKKQFKLLSWNIDGLDRLEETLNERTRGVIDVIER
jgi:hypothetical protein